LHRRDGDDRSGVCTAFARGLGGGRHQGSDQASEEVRQRVTSNAATSDTTTIKPVEKTEGMNLTDTAKKRQSQKPFENQISRPPKAAAKVGRQSLVNTASGIYHKGGQLYGATLQGTFMTEQEATQAGYRAAKSK
jgi:hypothetical protein